MKELFRIHKVMLSLITHPKTDYEIKKDIITNNLFGVDIEGAALEIARLRLWLSLIEDLDLESNEKEIETLPNIEYNIEEGNSLLGFTYAPTSSQLEIDSINDTTIQSIFKRSQTQIPYQ
jgi:hypothetical protein